MRIGHVLTEKGSVVGTVFFEKSLRGEGFGFIPFTSARKPSRKLWPSAESCIPAWAKKLGKFTSHTQEVKS